uniref:Multidrug resistance-associated protein lethal(2)03659 n=1 Tax=Clastoptera arizonana TaxID=38151 RepID=A0A1B6DBN7_9HEMI
MNSGKKSVIRPLNPSTQANFLSKITLAWTYGLFKKGFKKDLDVCDIYQPIENYTSSILGDVIEKNWNLECERAARKKTEPKFLRLLFHTFGVQLILLGVFLALADISLKVLQPLLLARFLLYFDTVSSLTKKEAYMYASGIVLCSVLETIILQPFWMVMFKLGMKIRVSCCTLLYRKALKLNKTTLGQSTVGQIVNLITNDVARLDMFILLFNYIWVGPLLTVFITYFLWLEIGLSALIGVAALLMFIPVIMWLGKKKAIYRFRTATRTDDRIFLMNEIITGIQVIKMYAWEKPFASLVAHVRKLEINEIRGSSYIQGVMISFLVFHSRFAMFCCVVSYLALGNTILPSSAYVMSSYFNILRTVMSDLFPLAISSTADALVSIKRLQEFMNYDESSTKEIKYDNLKKEIVEQSLDESVSIEIENASAKWRDDLNEDTLSGINIKFNKGELAVIIGPVGSGKTSLLSVILKELPLKSGRLNMSGSLSYAGQEPWVFGETVRQNIIFDSPYNETRYKQVVKACALKKDFKQLPFGDNTLVGDRGVLLSGGQRARVNLARAIYKKADIYLLDDPLSAVDTAVGKHLFSKCITGFLKGKTCILITHQLQFLYSVEHIILLKNGVLSAEGSFEQLQASEEDFMTLLNLPKPTLTTDDNNEARSKYSQSTAGDVNSMVEKEELIEEIRQKGSLRGSVLTTYLLAGGHWCVIIFLFLMFVLTQMTANFGDFWLNYWVDLEEYVFITNQNTTLSQTFRFPIIFDQSIFLFGFSVLIAGTIIISLLRSFIFFNICLISSKKMHDTLFKSITRTVMRFFHTNPSGRILNIFTKDIGALDETIPSLLFEVLQIALDLISIITIAMIVNIWLFIPIGVIVVILFIMRKYYMKTAQSLKRLEAITRSPVVSHLNTTLQGLTTIRAFKSENVFQEEFNEHQDLHSCAWFQSIAIRRAFGYCTDVVCLIFVAIVTFSFLILDKGWLGGNVGLVITQTITITSFFQWGMKQSAELESNLTSVERVIEYSKLDKEADVESTHDNKPTESWPDEGRLEFSHVSLNYSPELPYVLKDLNFIIQPKEKIGIVGRTGAGKSSLITALFRLVDIQGNLTIDGIDIKNIGLHDLRSKISIIPQEPVLFSGSIRMNLDPFEEYTDDVIWNALEEVQLKDIAKDAEGLSWRVTEGGGNFSVGQRQLICLARAIIRNNKILVLDEATANVDHRTDALIQSTIRRKFFDCTVLTIAHRLHTIIDADKILVMENGSVVEFDHPYKLLCNSNSQLNKMVLKTGKATSETLYSMALMNYKTMSSLDSEIIPM